MVSIIMPSYNCGKYVEETIRCVQAQTYKNWEIVFVDDCSTDDTIRIVNMLREQDKRIRLYQNRGNMGAAVARNHALQEAKGRWIAFLDSDDLWEPTKLEKQVRFMEANGYAFSYTCYEEVDENGISYGVEVRGPQSITKRGMYAYCWPGCLTVMYDSERIGLIQIANIRKNNDYAMWLKAIEKADCYLLDVCLAKYRIRSGSISNHSYTTMIKWHYRLFKEAMGLGLVASVIFTVLNLLFGTYKKIVYRNKVKKQQEMKIQNCPPQIGNNSLGICEIEKQTECLTSWLMAA